MLEKKVRIILMIAIETNPELQEMFKKMEIAIIRLMQKLEVIPEEVSKYMEEQATFRGQITPEQQQQQQQQMMMAQQQQQIQGLTPTMNTGSSNPMDLLQMQQMQQMQQMFSQMQQKPK
eukprot:GHVR01068613.1.p1 GENE.GHVR01068613.1~~GHVR01068613.1.p1  ORF type:complete len:119 (-),score=26.96 GHVR01068613.1:522-878(-)